MLTPVSNRCARATGLRLPPEEKAQEQAREFATPVSGELPSHSRLTCILSGLSSRETAPVVGRIKPSHSPRKSDGIRVRGQSQTGVAPSSCRGIVRTNARYYHQ